MTRSIPMTAERETHHCRITLPTREYSGTGVWVRCRTCNGIHYATPAGDLADD